MNATSTETNKFLSQSIQLNNTIIDIAEAKTEGIYLYIYKIFICIGLYALSYFFGMLPSYL